MKNFLLISLVLMPTLADGEEKEREQIGHVLNQPVYRDQIKIKTVEELEEEDQQSKLRKELHRLFSRPLMKLYIEKHKQELEPTKQEIDAFNQEMRTAYRKGMKESRPLNVKLHKETKQRLEQQNLSAEERQLLEIQLKTIEINLATPAELKKRLEKIQQRMKEADVPAKERTELEMEDSLVKFALHPFAGEESHTASKSMLLHLKLQSHLYKRYGGGRLLWQQFGTEAFDAMHKWLEEQEKQKKFQISVPKLHAIFYSYWRTMNHGAFLSNPKVGSEELDEFLNPSWSHSALTPKEKDEGS